MAEELARLRSHLDEIERLLAQGGELGKRLDFLIQELHREANTLGSKSAVLEMTRISVGKRWAQVTLVANDGRIFADAARSPRGGTDAPMSDAEILQKFHAFADPVIGMARAARLAELSANFDSLDSVGFATLLDLCLAPPSEPR